MCSKKSCTMNNNKIKVTECIREFKLRQQYPSVIKKSKTTDKMVVLNTSLQSLKPVSTNFTSKTNIQTKNELRKIKLKLPNGKYLGEFNVQVLPNNKDNTLKNKKISIINENKDKRFCKAIMSPNAMLENKQIKVITTTHLQSMKSADQKNLSPNSLYLNETSNQIKNNDADIKDDNISYRSKDIALNPVISSNQYHEESNHTNVENMDIDNGSNNYEGSEYNKVQSKLIQSKNNSNNTISNKCIPELENGLSLPNNSTVLKYKIINTAINDKDSNTSYVNENISTKETISNHDICEEMITLFQNENPDIKPFEILDNCDNKMNHQISLDKSKQTKTVCDITEKIDYSLLEPESSPNILSIACSNANIMSENPYSSKTTENLNINSLTSIPFYDNFTFSPFNLLQDTYMPSENLVNYDLIDNICNRHSTANKVKEVLSQPNILYSKISEQLKKDFKDVRKWDENGMLNIHKAVINNRIYDVQRHLMVLKACNVNMEIPTQSGMTSLELAIKYNACVDIVTSLLEAGANPASFQPIHESALILASKANSPLVSELIQYVPSNKLCDYFDFSGFAAIHYCAQYGNLKGINSLINKGANINLQESRSGRTALFLALENNYIEIAQKLIENGAQIDIPNFSGQTVMSLLDKHNDLSLITLVNAKK